MRLGVLSDLHGNGSAFDSALMAIGPVDLFIGLGDYISPTGRSFDIYGWLMRHTEEQTGAFVRGENDRLERTSATAHIWRNDPWPMFRFIDQLPDELYLTLEGHRVLLRHGYPLPEGVTLPVEGKPPNRVEETLPALRRPAIEQYVDLKGVDIFFWGKFHLPYIEVHPDVVLINPGSAGVSADQSLFSVGCMIVDLRPDEIVVEHRRTPIDLDAIREDVAREYTFGPPESSWLMRRFTEETKVTTWGWKTHWDRVRIRKTPQGWAAESEPLWDLAEGG